jgi:WhiB family transcriptional regulator, redox-sensing transcriptional regulator
MTKSRITKINVGFELTTKRPEIVDAPCQSVDPETFFPDPTNIPLISEAKSLCKQCNPNTKNDCLTFALTNKIGYGIWGGLTTDERKNVRRREQRSESKNSL